MATTLADVMSAIETLTEAGVLGADNNGQLVLWPTDEQVTITPQCPAARVQAMADEAVEYAIAFHKDGEVVGSALDFLAGLECAYEAFTGNELNTVLDEPCDNPDCTNE